MSSPPRRALVTGGSGGVGAAICRRFVQAGHFVYVHANRARDEAQALVDFIWGEESDQEALRTANDKLTAALESYPDTWTASVG